jgi:hypothetical protein
MTPSTIQVHVYYMNLMKNQILQNFQSREILKERATRQRIHFFNHLTKILCSMDSKCLRFRHKSYVEKIIIPKNMFGCPLKLILRFFMFLTINQNINTQLCVNVKTHHHHMNDLNWTIQFFSLNFVSNKCYL